MSDGGGDEFRDRFAVAEGGASVTQCVLCGHRGDRGCPAFPAGIPDAIILNRFDHRRPFPGQAGSAVFAPRPGVEPPLLAATLRELDGVSRRGLTGSAGRE